MRGLADRSVWAPPPHPHRKLGLFIYLSLIELRGLPVGYKLFWVGVLGRSGEVPRGLGMPGGVSLGGCLPSVGLPAACLWSQARWGPLAQKRLVLGLSLLLLVVPKLATGQRKSRG